MLLVEVAGGGMVEELGVALDAAVESRVVGEMMADLRRPREPVAGERLFRKRGGDGG